MFKKLLSNLPFNPSLIGEVSFYARRMNQEAAVRRTGIAFIILAMLVQVFAIVSPPEPTLAESNSDIIRGGFSSREQAVNYCRMNTQNFAEILLYHGVSCDMLAQSSVQNVKSTAHNKQLRSMGRVPQGPKIARTGKPTNESTVHINGKNYYMRNLWAWDSRASSTYKMLVMKNVQGQTIMIMFSCANIVTVGHYTPPAPKPKPKPKPPQKPAAPKPQPPKDVCPNIPGTQTTLEECDVCPNIPGIQSNQNECYPCPEAENDDSMTACLEMLKTASNKTQDIPDADGTLANANDVIIYTLSTTNKGSQVIKDFIVEENMSDVLEYAEVVDLHGGDMDDDQQIVRWPKEDIAAGATLTKQITVKVKDPIPQTPVSASDPGSYDMTMTNVYYGNSVNIKLPPSIAKTTELTVQTLPETGPGTALTAGFAVTTFIAYFFARSRLLAKELAIVKTDFTSAGSF